MANDGFNDGGGVQSYLDAVVRWTRLARHDIAMLYRDPRRRDAAGRLHALPQLSVARVTDSTPPSRRPRAFGPGICFSNNMRDLAVELAAARRHARS